MVETEKREEASKEAIQAQLSEQAIAYGVEYLSEAPENIDKAALNMITEEVARRYGIAAFEKDETLLKVAMVDPQNVEALNVLRFLSQNRNLEVEVYLVSGKHFSEIIDQYAAAEKMVEDVVKFFKEEEPESKKKEKDKKSIYENVQSAPVSKLVQVIIRHAIEGKASDIHIEPIDSSYRVRFRLDGILHASLALPLEVGRAVVARIKILSDLKIDEKRKPQDGRFKISEGGRTIDFRVSTLPVVEGEKVVMRVLDRDTGLSNMDSLGMFGRTRDILSKKIRETYGIILITGPTGSGKSTTLYSFLRILNQEERNIITLEDPVEYFLEGINQSQIKPEIGYTFASGLRSILRQDPNVIMVGEIRDGETAELAIHAALTGHLVFSTLHTNSAIGAIPRLVDMGIEPFLLTASLRSVTGQRLVRRICEKCREETKVTPALRKRAEEIMKGISEEEIKKYEIDISKGMRFYQGKGCEECGGTGLKGRIAIYETLDVNEEIQDMVAEKGGDEAEINRLANEQGMLTMRQEGLLKVLKGITTMSEVERITGGSLTVGGDTDDDKG